MSFEAELGPLNQSIGGAKGQIGRNMKNFAIYGLEIRRFRLNFFICSMLYSFLGGPPAFKHQGRAK